MNNKKRSADTCIERERTCLANERTMLSYLRTCFALIFAGLGVMKFLEDSKSNSTIAYALIAFGFFIGCCGIFLFTKRRKIYEEIDF